MDDRREGSEPARLGGGHRPSRRLAIKDELLLALLPTGTVLVVLLLLDVVGDRRVLFASLASSAFLIYLDPHHQTNTARALLVSHVVGAGAGLITFLLLGHGYPAAGAAMIATIVLMVLLDVVHPPAVSTSLTFALRSGAERDLALFALALAMVVALVALQRIVVWLLVRIESRARSG